MRRLRIPLLGYLLLVTVVAVIFAMAILVGPFRAIERSDYMTYHVAARIVLDGDGACLYETACQRAAQRGLIGDEPSFEGRVLPYNSPPWLAALVAPLGWLPLQAGFAIFTLIGLAVLASSVWRLGWGDPPTRLAATLLVLTAWPTVMGAIRGQLTLLVVGLLGLSVASARYRSGTALGLAALKPTLAPLWAAWQVLGGHWRAVGTAAAVTLGLIGASALIVSPQAVADYPGHLTGVLRAGAVGVHAEEMINWRGVAERLGAGGWLVAAGTLATLGLVVVTWWQTRSRSIGAAAAFLATPLVIPHANQHEAVLAGVGILLTVAAAGRFRAWVAAGAVGTHAMLWTGPLLGAASGAWLLFTAQLIWLGIVVVVAASLNPERAKQRGTSVQ
jgi:hypothetical protein